MTDAAAGVVPYSGDDDSLPSNPLPREYYLSDYWHETDLDRVFRARWLFAGHGSQLATPGHFITFEVGNDSVIITRNAAGELSAFHNVCRHRGARICQDKSGEARAFRCSYHGWTYGLDGELLAAPKMAPSFDKSAFPAKPVWIEEWNGIIFVHLGTDIPAQSVADALANVDFAQYELHNTKVVAERVYEVESNWKVAAETFAECYHCQINHPALCRVLDPMADLETWEEAESTDGEAYSGDYVIFTEDLGPAMFEGARTMSLDGDFVCQRLLGAADRPSSKNGAVSWFPHWGMFVQPDYATTFSWLPVSPTRTLFKSTWLVHADAVEGVDYEIDKLIEFMDVTNVEDGELCKVVQLGVNSPAYDNTGPYHPLFEGPVRGFMRTYLEYVADAPRQS